VHGMRTVKSLALEPRQRRVWDDRSAESISVRFRVDKISAVAQSLTGLLEKLMSVAIVGLGALDVFDGTMTIGALVAFNMLAGRVSGPLVQIVTMVHEYQEVALSVRMLGEIMNQRQEQHGRGRGLRPDIAGRIEFDRVSFRYGPDGQPALDDVSFTVPAGSVFGIVGKSGSGKTTIAETVARLVGAPPGARIVESDRIRKAMHGVSAETRLPDKAYRPEVSETVYREMAWRAELILAQGGCVVADATFEKKKNRDLIGDVAGRLAAPFVGAWLEADPALLWRRVNERQDGPSDATVDVLSRQLDRAAVDIEWHRFDASPSPQEVADAILGSVATDAAAEARRSARG
ncbi:AAA family ATPase, partial [Rhizobiaceae sp. 2RAB30]